MSQQNDVSQELQQTLESRAFELAYEEACHQVEAVCKTERARQLRVQILVLQDENDELQSQLIHNAECTDILQRHIQETQKDLEACSAKLESAQGDLWVKSREIETLKVELNSLHRVTMDSTRLLTEKLTMARELSSLRPEVDHLRSQAASHQSLLAEKLALQRQLSTIQVELETEKRSTQRALAKEDKLLAGDAKLESRIEALQAELTKECHDRQKVEREAQKTATESENRKTTLESRLDAFRNKLRTTKEQLREAQAALEAAQATANTTSSRSTTSLKPTVSLSKNSRKRVASQIDADSMIGTPGDLPAAKKNKRPSALVGEKSTFSITPFLSRIASVAPESLPSDNGGSDDEGEAELVDRLSADGNSKRLSGETGSVARNLKLTKGAVEAKKVDVLEKRKSSQTNSGPPPGRKQKAAPMLEQVAEEEGSENDGVAMPIPKAANRKALYDETVIEGAQTKKMKRKILGGGLGKTLFDEDSGCGVKGGVGTLEVVKGFRILSRGGLGGSNFEPRKALNTSLGSFGAISPRKER